MRGWELVLRMFSEMFGVEYFKLLTGQATFTDQQKQVFEEYLGRINLDVEEFGYSFGDIDKALETTYAKKAPDVIFVDFIQLIDWRAIGDERIALMEYIRQAKQLAKKFNVAFVIVSQLRRPPTGADCNRPPELTDLFGSGSLEQLSDKVIFCYREIDDSQKSTRHFINLAKNRQGPTGKSEVNFDGRFYRFTDIKEDDYARKVRLALDGKVE
uniref:Putative helicase n=1 Tax=viral metagenome TaxID=1070528 RepID=A0A6M3KKI4_9ZZZZ